VSEVAAMMLFELSVEKLVPLDASSYSNYVSEAISSSDLKANLKAKEIDYGKVLQFHHEDLDFITYRL
jgi:hypothetical protein